jgi:putative transposase
MITESGLPLKIACETMGINRVWFYKNNSLLSNHDGTMDLKIKKMIEKIIRDFPGYGYKRVSKQLQRQNHIINHKKVYRIMYENNILYKKKKKFKILTTDSNHNLPVYPNLAKGLKVTKLNQLWVADITYILLPGGHVYLAVIIDVFSRKCIGWELSRNIDTDLVLNALKMAIRKRRHLGFESLIHHSDQGVQYASHEYVNLLKEISAKISMCRKGNPYDNAFVESFMKTLKAEEVYVSEYLTFEDAYKNIKRFIEIVYNKKRLHSGIGYKPPVEFEKEVLNSG